jgi:hypothetical protein
MEYLDIPFGVPMVVSFTGTVKRLTRDRQSILSV